MRAPDRSATGAATGAARPAGRRQPLESVARLCVLALAQLALSLPGGAARADERVTLVQSEVRVGADTDPGVFVSAQFDFDLPAALRDAIDHGIALYFVIDFELSRRRWYWFDQQLVSTSLGYRLSYSPLTRQYRLARGGLAQPFESLDEALATVRRVRDWRVADAGLLDASDRDRYRARIRLRLDTSMLPKPFQVDALTDRDWALASDWSRVKLAADAANQ
jgi:hypothetical protein